MFVTGGTGVIGAALVGRLLERGDEVVGLARSDAAAAALQARSVRVGQLIAERAKDKGINAVVFDRGGYLYHGRIKALADAARAAGLEF